MSSIIRTISTREIQRYAFSILENEKKEIGDGKFFISTKPVHNNNDTRFNKR